MLRMFACCVSVGMFVCACEDGPMGVRFISVPTIEAVYELPKFGRLCVVSCM